ncbi:hypothetical protein CC77DRAFT_223095 [Alternaria alternata]|uniref:Extracellular membrane protein CFEM domain-containing protein n=1 Tax=Alternaria alternata TaxID=5599 RepID=A0A177DET4_ALTAL|nr:hypothetical protein CC77DRAFT_223095 [Alternaria alternata]OAG18285.1 hypothetical protein CC77DRAFT_223095 [Alternaria alternata]
MRFITAIAVAISASASFVAAQDKCDAQNIVDTCVQGYQSRIDACNENPNDFICLCDVYRDVLVCYNNCPDSLEKPPVQNTVTSYCGAAELAPLPPASLVRVAASVYLLVPPLLPCLLVCCRWSSTIAGGRAGSWMNRIIFNQ